MNIFKTSEEFKELILGNKQEIAKDIENEVINSIDNVFKNRKCGTSRTYTQDEVEDNFGMGLYISKVLVRKYNGHYAADCHDTEIIQEIENIIIKNPRFVNLKEKITDVECYFRQKYMWEPNKNEREVLDNDSKYDDKSNLLVEICASGIESCDWKSMIDNAYPLWSHVTLDRIDEEIFILVEKWGELIKACEIEEDMKNNEYNIDPILDSMIDQCIYTLNRLNKDN